MYHGQIYAVHIIHIRHVKWNWVQRITVDGTIFLKNGRIFFKLHVPYCIFIIKVYDSDQHIKMSIN